MRQSHCVFAVAERHEPYELRGSRTVLRAPGGEIPPGDSTKAAVGEARSVTYQGVQFM